MHSYKSKLKQLWKLKEVKIYQVKNNTLTIHNKAGKCLVRHAGGMLSPPQQISGGPYQHIWK